MEGSKALVNKTGWRNLQTPDAFFCPISHSLLSIYLFYIYLRVIQLNSNFACIPSSYLRCSCSAHSNEQRRGGAGRFNAGSLKDARADEEAAQVAATAETAAEGTEPTVAATEGTEATTAAPEVEAAEPEVRCFRHSTSLHIFSRLDDAFGMMTTMLPSLLMRRFRCRVA